ncbi:MAG: hypothetical protein DMG51_03805 [Acidobacteria bacterium]|nr:MAG: hypothetical protein DMG51_03805 [Acidobacteriota bacterium]
MPFMDLIKKAIFEEAPQTGQPPAKPAPSPAAPRPLDPAPAYVPAGTRDNQFYMRLAKQTELSAVPELAKIEAFAAPLAPVITDKASSTFNKQTDDVSRTEVDAKIAKIGDLNEAIQQKQKEITDLQQQVKSVQLQTEASRAKLQEAKSSFAAALERRRAEIQQQRKEFETILG